MRTQSRKVANRRQRVKERLLQVAAEKFAAKGPDVVSLDEIIEEAEIAKNTFYTFFSSKEDLISTIVEPVFKTGTREFKLLQGEEPYQLAKGIADVYLTLWDSNRHALLFTQRLGPKHFPLFEETHMKYSRALRAILGKIEKSGELRNGNAVLSARLIARSAVQFLEIYSQERKLPELFRLTIEGLLLK